MKKGLLLLISIFTAFSILFAKDYKINDFGAIGDGKTLDTKAVQDAINACTENGGGRVIIPSGKKYMIGTIYLKDHVTLYLENGSLLIASTDIADYATDTYKTRYKLEKQMNQCLIYAQDAKNIAIEGYGTIDGNGYKEYFNSETGRPMLMRFLRCDEFLPASGIYMRHINDLYLNNIQIKTVSGDERPPIVFDDVPRYSINEIYYEGEKLNEIVEIK